VVKNRDLYIDNQEIYTRYNTNFHLPMANLTAFQRGVYFFGVKLFNHLPIKIKNVSKETKLFKRASKIFLILNSFYSMEEYFNYCNNRILVLL